MILFALIPGLLAWSALAYALATMPLWLALPLAPLCLCAVFLLALFPLRLVLGERMEAASRLSCLHYLLQAFYVTRYLHYRALGAATHLSTNFALDTRLRGLRWMRFGPDATVALFSSIHATREAPVVIGAGAFIGKGVIVPPGCNVGEGALVGLMNALAPGEIVPAKKRVPDYSRLPRS
jgi:hypothetical protein